jgi:hypothetical protein
MARGWALIFRGIIFMTPQRFQGRITTAVLFILLPAVSAQAATLSLDEALQPAERNALSTGPPGAGISCAQRSHSQRANYPIRA